MAISLISTVKNEAASIGSFLESVARQTLRPDEVILVDGGSTDRTVEIVRSYRDLPIRVIVEPCNIARGRNIAIAAARFDYIAVTDAGCRLQPDWLERLFENANNADVLVGNYRPLIRDLFDACQYSLVGLFKNDTDLKRFCISSRSLAFRKNVWQELGGYPEWLNYSEDMYFHKQMLRGSYRFHFVPAAIVEWEQRSTIGGVYRQYFRYMEGDGMARMHTKRHILRFCTYAIGLLLLFASFFKPVALVPLVIGAAFYLSVPFSSFLRQKKYSLAGPGLFLIPILLVLMDLAKMSGYLSGLFASSKVRHLRLRDSAVS